MARPRGGVLRTSEKQWSPDTWRPASRPEPLFSKAFCTVTAIYRTCDFPCLSSWTEPTSVSLRGKAQQLPGGGSDTQGQQDTTHTCRRNTHTAHTETTHTGTSHRNERGRRDHTCALQHSRTQMHTHTSDARTTYLQRQHAPRHAAYTCMQTQDTDADTNTTLTHTQKAETRATR